jgi:hypothetical protein
LRQSEEGVFEGGACYFEAAEGFVAEEHLADYRLCVGSYNEDRGFIAFDAGYARECVEELV